MKTLLSVFFGLLLCSADLWAGEMLLYAVRYESLERTPDIYYTRVFSTDPATTESTHVFSDEDTPIRLINRRGEPGYPGEVLAVGANRIFAHAVERTLNPGRWYHHQAAAVYELSADGANQVRKVVDVLGQHALAELFVSPAGDKIGYINEIDDHLYIFIHESGSGKLLYKIDARPIFLDCFAARIGWLPDGKRLFFTLYAGDEHMTSAASYEKEGSYIMNEDGTGLAGIPQPLTAFPAKAGYAQGPFMPECVGGRPGGTCIFRDAKMKKGPSGSDLLSFLYEVNPETKSREEIPLEKREGLHRFKLSPAGKYIAFIESPSGSGDEHIRVKNLETNEERLVFSLSRRPFKGYYLGLIGWILPIAIPGKEALQLHEYPSPDGKYHARVIPLARAPYGLGESKIEIRSKTDALLYSKSFGSEDGEHGSGVERAEWSPDSMFFVYSMSSSGGHQALHFPTYFVAVIDFKTRNLDDYLASITTPDFTISAPDVIHVVGFEPGDFEKVSEFASSLSKLTRK